MAGLGEHYYELRVDRRGEPAADEAMLDFIARRKEVIPDEFG